MDIEALACVSEIQSVLDEGAADKVTVAYADTKIHAPPQTFEAGDLLVVDAKGGGGTSFRLALDWARDNVPDASAIVYLTDGYTSDWGDAPACPLIWAMTGDPGNAAKVSTGAPFGESIFLGE